MSSFCSYYNQGQCRSCTWIETKYAEQIIKKENSIHAALNFLQSFELEPSVTSSPKGFRNRAKMTVTGTTDTPIIGLTGDEKLDEGRELLNCPIQHPKLNELIAAMPDFIRRGNLIPYQIENRQGELKGLIAFYSPLSNQMYLRFVLRSKECVARIKKLLPSLQKQFPNLVCISVNIQPIPHAILEGQEEIILTEQTFIVHQLGTLKLRLTPQAFVQTNASIATRLYKTASSWIADIHPRKMLELYCGNGAFSFFAASTVAEIMGIEINSDAVKTANESAREMELTHLTFKTVDVTNVETDILTFEPDLILANPPRRGLGEDVGLIERHSPKHFLYSSCSIETMADDIRKLSRNYQLHNIQLFDMFPHTEHFETLAWFERN